MTKTVHWIERLKPSVSKRFLCLTGAAIWAFAGYRVLKITVKAISLSTVSSWIIIPAGLIGLAIFFTLVFRRVTKRNVKRIDSMKSEKPCIFAFISWKSYLMIFFMIGLSVLVERFQLMPPFVAGVFFIALGGSLLLSAIILIYAGFTTRGPSVKNDCPNTIS